MYRHILIGLDGSRVSQLALARGLELARQSAARLTLLHAYEDPIPGWADPESLPYRVGLYQDLETLGRQVLERAAEEVRAAGLEAQTRLERKMNPGDALVAASRECDLLIVGAHGRRGFDRLIMGSVAEGVARRATCDVLIVKPSAPQEA